MKKYRGGLIMRVNKFAAGFAVLALVLGLLLIQPLALAQRAVTIFLDGREIRSDVAPVIIDGRTMVPIRAISEGLGMAVEWDDKNYRAAQLYRLAGQSLPLPTIWTFAGKPSSVPSN